MGFRLALAQMLVLGGDRAGNLDRADKMIENAAWKGAAIVLLPEAMDLGWTHPSALDDADVIPGGVTFRRLTEAAQRDRIFVCSGLVERDGSQVFNSAVLIDPDGNLLLHHRKINELEIGHSYYAQGDRLQVCHTRLGTIGLMICADAFARDRVLARSLGYMGADILLSPSSWAVPADHDNVREPYGELWERVYRETALEFSVWIAGVSNVGEIEAGPWQGRRCIGCSQVTNPGGERILVGPYGVESEALLIAEIEPVQRPARGCGWAEQWRRDVNPGSPRPESHNWIGHSVGDCAVQSEALPVTDIVRCE